MHILFPISFLNLRVPCYAGKGHFQIGRCQFKVDAAHHLLKLEGSIITGQVFNWERKSTSYAISFYYKLLK
jgi:hypothetical protein